MTRAAPAARTCAAGCGIPLHPAAAAGGHTTHPGCDPIVRPSAGRREWRWACLACGMSGPADSAEPARHLAWVHDVYACPAIPTDSGEHALRVARRVDLTRRYPAHAPAWPMRR